MNAQMWLSVFRVGDTGRPDRPAGVYGAAFVTYEEGSALTYHELLVARLVDAARRRITITDIWVDSEASRQGGRSLWAIPKELATLTLDDRRIGPASHTTVTADLDGSRIARGRFVGLPGAAVVRLPLAATTVQRREPADGTGSGGEVDTPWTGSSRTLPALATWEFAEDGPLGFLHDRRPLVSFRLRDVRLRFG
jgi:hypothetical protein